MVKKLSDIRQKENAASPLTNVKRKKFKIAFGAKLDNKFCFKSHAPNTNAKEFQKFLEQTVYKGLYISDVEDLFKRKRGKDEISIRDVNEHDVTEEIEVEILHFGKDRNPFRIFGYYDRHSYFNITRIDPQHKTHK